MTAFAERASHPLALASAGIGVIAVSFGMARYGFGLLAPDIRGDFGLTSGALGLLAAASYIAYLAATVAAGVLSAHLGARAIVGAGGACAVAGMTLAGLAQSPPALFAGLLVAGASAGLVFPPFSDIVAQRFPAGRAGGSCRPSAPARAGESRSPRPLPFSPAPTGAWPGCCSR